MIELYEGWVRHRRFDSPARAFRHSLYMTLTTRGPVKTLQMPRSLGFDYNPVRFHYRMDGERLERVAAEVMSTPRSERRTYEFEAGAGTAAKTMRVSPFLSMDEEYVIDATPPGERLIVHIENRRDGERVFDSTLSLVRRPRGQLRRLRLRYPAQPLRALALIYGHAALLALRGAPRN